MIMGKKGIMQGVFTYVNPNNNNRGGIQEGGYNPGRDMVTGSGNRNTRTEQVEGSLDYERRSTNIGLADNYFEELCKGTYI